MAPLTPEDYKIAWICALPLEAAAARAMLDKIHHPPQPITDQNAYEFGELNGHYIVIAHLPDGVYGTISATAIVSRMRLTFTRLQFGLMVEIGGGVPSKNNDICLGMWCNSRLRVMIQIFYSVPRTAMPTWRLIARRVTESSDKGCKKARFIGPSARDTLLRDGDGRHYGRTSDSCERGICDYCDSHKQKQWQGYASLTAAAFAKLLLSMVPVYPAAVNFVKGTRERHWMVPLARNPRFVSRQEEIMELGKMIAMQDGPRRIALTGLGGVGKTQAALELAYRIRDKDKELSVFWLPCTSHAMVEQSFLKMRQMVGLSNVKPAEIKEQIKSYFSSEHGGKWLLIFDNADDTEMWLGPNDTAPGFEQFLPQSENGHILFTTRNRELAVDLTFSNNISIPDEDQETAQSIPESLLLRKHLVEDHGMMVALLEKLAYLPLAIAQASACINKKCISLPAYFKILQEEEQVAVELLSEDFRDPGRYKDIESSVITTWWISFKQIQHQAPLAADYLSFMACISPRNIPQSLLPS
ncbi:hypothetical protein AN6955.2 [Aspergillus nidulans FGSC A4]|uniref:NB-ARC domain-containing protein n=1 Tax=Emericella nidulans (strain FGSC A4 / ATCC 38163 / CBS 112.46 / NRRL 194 / M139) TaxID=227321 RepID=Q5AXM5_EMENI|nr:hypothetical protein [Aspergillus nidulans FGSC A4]EAA57710.1 hypothetical protein AN6955.2 [Aspergillus nidulans FGSC A4]CBF71817.1 TPA: conserved hypothetical protein [Aspergillus nidulans FGSC A4]|eukprot:XP_664559.1 hypothetical protein AN6955.2 [Aspergillus nidulans FGSC A4]